MRSRTVGAIGSRIRCHAAGVGLALGSAAVLAVVSGPQPADAYRFYDNGALDYIVGSDQALRWSAEVWGPRETLVWEVEEGEAWSLLADWVDGPEDVVPLVEQSLAVWSGIETADIRWRVRGMASPSETSRFMDSRNRVFLDTERGVWPGAHLRWTRNRELDIWELEECDIGLPWGWWLDENMDPRPDLDPDGVRRGITRWVAGQSGHCLGLGQAAAYPTTYLLRASRDGDNRVWSRQSAFSRDSPQMGNPWRPLAPDDRTAASLLRPRRGWLQGVGSLSGRLEEGGEAVPYAHVQAFPIGEEGGVLDPIGAFTNAEGAFLIEGLAPGDYVLWAHPIRYSWRHRPLVESGAATDLLDAVFAHPVRVEAGRGAEPVTIPMRPGRE